MTSPGLGALIDQERSSTSKILTTPGSRMMKYGGATTTPSTCLDKLSSHRNARAASSAAQGFLSLFLATVAISSTLPPPSSQDTFGNVPSTLSGAEKPKRIQKPNSAKAESCTRKCVATCIRGGGGAPGEGPLNVRKPLVVFKEGFRSRQYCLVECSDICNLIGNGDDGP